MLPYEREFFISRIDAGYIRYKKSNIVLLIFPPSKDVLYEANELYNEKLKEANLLGLLNSEETFEYLLYYGLWGDKEDKEYSKLPDNINTLKKELYNNKFRSIIRDRARQLLLISKNRLLELEELKGCWSYTTVDGYASLCKWLYIIENSTFTIDRIKYNWSGESLVDMLAYYNKHTLSEPQIRELARTEPWTNIWTSRKSASFVFCEPMTSEQRALIGWSSLYENIQQSPDCPEDVVIQDDDMLDGWLIIQKEKRDDELNNSYAEKKLQNSRILNSQEIFYPADTIEDANKIVSLNDSRGQQIRKARFAAIDKHGSVSVLDLPDIKQRLYMEANAKFAQSMKGK